jgi:hypothetical protein
MAFTVWRPVTWSSLTGLGVLRRLSDQHVSGHGIRASAGSFTLSGQAAALLAHSDLVLTADPGSLTLSGQAAAPHATLAWTASAGSLTLTGQAATLSAGRRLLASPGTFILTGQPALFMIDLTALLDLTLDDLRVSAHLHVNLLRGTAAWYSAALHDLTVEGL